ncbi:hypothetical protein KIPB_006004 [Kipferlia bialata]|uniref:Uncharacterized protein n=1 Tax=Kipferlia bialata TaxID=797122 RepID=A0A9K3CWB5_9EUKA|nr:hypothetical protein KIPB_006004 [Kipferlia bialata]|eukprot:g6004.t1
MSTLDKMLSPVTEMSLSPSGLHNYEPKCVFKPLLPGVPIPPMQLQVRKTHRPGKFEYAGETFRTVGGSGDFHFPLSFYLPQVRRPKKSRSQLVSPVVLPSVQPPLEPGILTCAPPMRSMSPAVNPIPGAKYLHSPATCPDPADTRPRVQAQIGEYPVKARILLLRDYYERRGHCVWDGMEAPKGSNSARKPRSKTSTHAGDTPSISEATPSQPRRLTYSGVAQSPLVGASIASPSVPKAGGAYTSQSQSQSQCSSLPSPSLPRVEAPIPPALPGSVWAHPYQHSLDRSEAEDGLERVSAAGVDEFMAGYIGDPLPTPQSLKQVQAPSKRGSAMFERVPSKPPSFGSIPEGQAAPDTPLPLPLSAVSIGDAAVLESPRRARRMSRDSTNSASSYEAPSLPGPPFDMGWVQGVGTGGFVPGPFMPDFVPGPVPDPPLSHPQPLPEARAKVEPGCGIGINIFPTPEKIERERERDVASVRPMDERQEERARARLAGHRAKDKARAREREREGRGAEAEREREEGGRGTMVRAGSSVGGNFYLGRKGHRASYINKVGVPQQRRPGAVFGEGTENPFFFDRRDREEKRLDAIREGAGGDVDMDEMLGAGRKYREVALSQAGDDNMSQLGEVSEEVSWSGSEAMGSEYGLNTYDDERMAKTLSELEISKTSHLTSHAEPPISPLDTVLERKPSRLSFENLQDFCRMSSPQATLSPLQVYTGPPEVDPAVREEMSPSEFQLEWKKRMKSLSVSAVSEHSDLESDRRSEYSQLSERAGPKYQQGLGSLGFTPMDTITEGPE